MFYRCSLNGYTFFPLTVQYGYDYFFHYSTSLWNVICESSLWFYSLIYFKNTMTVWIEFSLLQFMLLSSFSGPILHSLSFIWCCSFMLLIVYWTLWYVRIFHKSGKTGGNFKLSDTMISQITHCSGLSLSSLTFPFWSWDSSCHIWELYLLDIKNFDSIWANVNSDQASNWKWLWVFHCEELRENHVEMVWKQRKIIWLAVT